MTLPTGWIKTTVGDVSVTKLGKMLDANKNKGEPVVYLRNVNVRWGAFDLSDLLEMRVTAEERDELAVRDGDLFMCEGGEPGRCAVWRGGERDLVFQKAIHRIRPLDAVDADYIAAFIAHLAAIDGLSDLLTGTTIKHLSQVALQRITFPVPPAAEQGRIVAKLTALTVRLARTRDELERVAALAAKLRQSVLSQAFSGNLTAAWRKREGYADVDWQTCPLSEIADVQGGIQVGKKRPADAVLVEVPYLRVANVQRGWLRLDEIKTLAVTAEERDRLLLKDGDILMNEGGDRDKLGRGWVWRDQVPDCIHQNHVFRVRLKNPDFPPEFISHYANEFGQSYFIDQGTQTTNLASISKRRVMALPVPVPPVAEAREIVLLITAAFARADRLEAEAARDRALLDRIEAAILAKAFRGELVPQEPNDEPASVLLDRIRAERAAAPKPKRGRARKAGG
ncbi:restriction endonuclease subunit S [Sphingomonas sp. Leaf67]|uniref:restriction endonuclease subunit S n=1 Tax=Sphingomonas sp. Leaf67 TaxID=1736230 RepID=UPI0009E76E54|nr:restriction endonuclease subunit S [Sphingomonas sp. Leaf67]